MTRTPLLYLGALDGLAAARALLHLPDGEPATYALRIGGAMILAAGLFLAGFANAWHLATSA